MSTGHVSDTPLSPFSHKFREPEHTRHLNGPETIIYLLESVLVLLLFLRSLNLHLPQQIAPINVYFTWKVNKDWGNLLRKMQIQTS